MSTCPSAVSPVDAVARRPRREAWLWLIVLAPIFFATYGLANWLTARRDGVPTIAFEWESSIPFLPWTILPYWSIDLLYGLSLFVCAGRSELEVHVKRLLTAQFAAVICFAAFPLRYGSERPGTDGVAGALFDLLSVFDRPFNQAPSLHVALSIILWSLYANRLSPALRPLVDAWFVLVAASVLTTYQHHFIDVPTGAALGWLCVWLWPASGQVPLSDLKVTRDPVRRRIALCYATAAIVTTAAALNWRGIALWLLWPALSLLIVSAAYVVGGGSLFQKLPDGRLSSTARWLLAPYLLGAWINSRLWTAGKPAIGLVRDGVWIGRHASPTSLRTHGAATLIDLTAELPAPRTGVRYRLFPMLDLITPAVPELRQAGLTIEAERQFGDVLVTCALGYTRSAAAIATWLLLTERAADVEAAIATVRHARPWIILRPATIAAITAAGSRPR